MPEIRTASSRATRATGSEHSGQKTLLSFREPLITITSCFSTVVLVRRVLFILVRNLGAHASSVPHLDQRARCVCAPRFSLPSYEPLLIINPAFRTLEPASQITGLKRSGDYAETRLEVFEES